MQWHWRSTKQATTAQSSTAAELVALPECMKDANLRMRIAEEIGHKIEWPIKIQVDNQAAVSFQIKGRWHLTASSEEYLI